MDKFEGVLGHDFAKNFLASTIKNDKIAHAYLFVGPAQTGKYKLAIEFAKALQCAADNAGISDAEAERRKKIESGNDPDVLLIDPGEENSIPIDEIRKLEHHLSLFPYYSKYKIAIVRSAHKFTVEAVNAFLKTLEEPKGNSVIILVADNINSLPRTLLSRTQILRFGPAREEAIRGFLADKGASGEEAEKIAAAAEGRVGKALDLWKDAGKLSSHYDKKRAFESFLVGTLEEKFAFIDKLIKDEDNIGDTLGSWLIYSRAMLVAEYLPAKRVAGHASGKKAAQGLDSARLARLDSAKLAKFIGNLNSILNLINNSNVNRRLALENLALEILAP